MTINQQSDMKQLIVTTNSRFLHTPSRPVALALFWALALLPVIVRLLRPIDPITSPLMALGPLLAGFWLAATVCQLRLNCVALGLFLGTVLWVVNWLMLAGSDCCSIG